MIKIDFYKLPRPIQDNLLDAFRGQFTPSPILVRPALRPVMPAWIAVSAAAAIGLLVLSGAGFGKAESALSLHPTAAAAAYVLLAAVCALGVLKALAYRAGLRALPFAPGLYLFSANLIDARDHEFRVYPITELSSVSAGAGGAVVVQFGGATFSFPVADEARTRDAISGVEASRERMRAEPDAKARRILDPFEPPSVESPLAPPIPLSRSAPIWARYAYIVAVAVGANVGVGLFFLRNMTSDNRMFAVAEKRDDVASYKSYLGRGRRHVAKVSQVLLPRAELRAAVALGSVEAIDAFIKAYPNTGIKDEVDAARKAALAAEFERARKANTLAALLSFADRYPNAGLDKTFDQAKHALYIAALSRFKSQVPKGAESTAEFAGRLLAYAERMGAKSTPQGLRGPTVQIRFRRQPSQDMDHTDELVMKSPTYAGAISLPSRYITPANLEPHETSAAQGLAEGLARGFDPEIVTFAPGPPLGAEEQINAATPTIAVNYRVEASGAAQARTKPRGIFVGLTFYFKTEFTLPGDSKPLTDKQQLVQRVPVDLLRPKGESPGPGVTEAAVYGAMIRDAFVDIDKRYLGKWFKAP